jgi:hypothetical protein
MATSLEAIKGRPVAVLGAAFWEDGLPALYVRYPPQIPSFCIPISSLEQLFFHHYLTLTTKHSGQQAAGM